MVSRESQAAGPNPAPSLQVLGVVSSALPVPSVLVRSGALRSLVLAQPGSQAARPNPAHSRLGSPSLQDLSPLALLSMRASLPLAPALLPSKTLPALPSVQSRALRHATALAPPAPALPRFQHWNQAALLPRAPPPNCSIRTSLDVPATWADPSFASASFSPFPPLLDSFNFFYLTFSRLYPPFVVLR